MILNLSKIKTESLLLFCKDLILSYEDKKIDTFSIDKDVDTYINDMSQDMLKQLNRITRESDFYIKNAKNYKIKAILNGYNFINSELSKELSEGLVFNPSMLCFSLLATWFKELNKENKSKEYIYFLLFPYSLVFDKLLLNIKDDKFKATNIMMINIAERVVFKLDKHSVK